MGFLEKIDDIGPLPEHFREMAIPSNEMPPDYGVHSIALRLPPHAILQGQNGVLQTLMHSTGWSKAGVVQGAYSYILLERSRNEDYGREPDPDL